MTNIFELKVQPRYFALLREGIKVVEGRLYNPQLASLKVGELLRFINDLDRSQTLVTSVVYLRKYDSFQDMLTQEGLEKCLPGILNIQEGVELYRNFPKYRELEKRDGVIALGIKVLTEDLHYLTNKL